VSDLIVSYPRVDDAGQEFGGEISFRFSKLIGVERMYKWSYAQIGDAPREERQQLIDGCCSIFVDRQEFSIKVSYEEIVAKLKEFCELYG
jgi:hypothetical protein